MRRFQLVFLMVAGLAEADLKTDLSLTSGQTIGMGGDSIETTWMFSHYVLAWFQLQYPELDLITICSARSGASLVGWGMASTAYPPADGSQYERLMNPWDPDVFILKMGDNGGQSGAAHKSSYQDLITNWMSGKKIIIIGCGPRNASTDTIYSEEKNDGEAEIAALDSSVFHAHTFDQIGAGWLSNYDNTIDLQQPSVEPTLSNGAVRDDVHPGPAGQIILAWAALSGLGAETLVSEVTINASTGGVTGDNGCTISSVSATTSNVSFDRLDAHLPWAIDAGGMANADSFASTYSINGGSISDWQTYAVTVTNLVAGTYRIEIDGELVTTATHTALASGVNLSNATTGPVFDQVQEVLGEFRDLQGINRTTGADISPIPTGSVNKYISAAIQYQQSPYPRGATWTSTMSSYVSAVASNMAEIHADAQPVTRTWTVSLVGGGSERSAQAVTAGSVTIGP